MRFVHSPARVPSSTSFWGSMDLLLSFYLRETLVKVNPAFALPPSGGVIQNT